MSLGTSTNIAKQADTLVFKNHWQNRNKFEMGYLLWLLLIFMTLLFSACSSQATPLPEAQLLTQVWQALQPNTSSYNRANWEVVESQSLSEREASERFAGEPDPSCVPGLSAQNGGGSDFAVTVTLHQQAQNFHFTASQPGGVHSPARILSCPARLSRRYPQFVHAKLLAQAQSLGQ